METTFIIAISLFILFLIRSFLFLRKNTKKNQLPPGPSFLSSIFLLLTNPLLKFEHVLIKLRAKYGPLFALKTPSGPAIFVANHSLAHEVLIKKGAVFSDRPKSFPMRNISSASYGPTWRLLRRNLVSEFMHPSRIKSYSWARKWTLHIFMQRVQEQQNPGLINVIDHLRYSMFCLLVLMCFGEKFDESRINEIGNVCWDMLFKVSTGRFAMFNMFPRLGKVVFRSRWKEFQKLCSDREDVLIPLIKSRILSSSSTSELQNVAYVDTLVNLELPKEDADDGNGGKLSHNEMVSMCSEFFNGGTDTTATALQWIIANLVKHPRIQRKLYDEIVGVVGTPPSPPPTGVEVESVINEKELKKMPYLKAVVLEGLRRHPPLHFVLPHSVMKEVELQGYTIPEGATINFLVGEMGLDPKVWDEPMEFKPERFMVNNHGGVFDISGNKEIKMMPFGAGRRICPGNGLAMFHLEYFVANLIWYFDWTAPDGYDVDLSEEVKLTVVMKNPFRTQITPRTMRRAP